MTPEQEASDLVMEITQRAKQGKKSKKLMARLLVLAANDEAARRIYSYFIDSIKSNLEDQ